MIVRTATGSVSLFFVVCVLAGFIQWETSDRRLALFAFGALLVGAIAARIAARTPPHAAQPRPQSERSTTRSQPLRFMKTSAPTAADVMMHERWRARDQERAS